MKKTTKLLLICIVILAAVLRLYKLDVVPPGVNRDEASIGITARSLMTNGRDEYGKLLPLSFESFGDWKMPLYMYLTTAFVKVFGLSELAVRLPSALAGIASVVALYYLAVFVFASESTALLAALVLALMPWHIHISRVESEAIVATLCMILGSLAFFSALKKKSVGSLIVSALLFASTYYTYHGNHVSTTLLLLGMAGIFWRDIVKIPSWWKAVTIGAIITGFILLIGISADGTKLSGISIFGDPTIVHTKIEQPRLDHDNPNSFLARIEHNRLTYAVTTIFQNYLTSYGPEFLFIRGGGNNAHNIQGYGNMHPLEAPLLLLGIIWLALHSKKKESKFILWWILIGGVAASITKDAPHSNRMLMVVPSFAIAVAAGISLVFDACTKQYRVLLVSLLMGAYIVSVGYYADRYFIHFPKTESHHWGYGYKTLTPILFSPTNVHKKVIMTHPETSPYAYILFYSDYPMDRYQKEAKRYPISRDGFTDVAGFGRFSFRPINWDTDGNAHDTLVVVDPEEMPSAYASKVIATIRLPDNTTQFVVIDTNK